VRASGHNSITMNYQHDDEKHALEIGRIQYEAARKAGFADKDISINVNGKKYTKSNMNELFKDEHAPRLGEIDRAADKDAAARRAAVKEISAVTDPKAPGAPNSNQAHYEEMRQKMKT